MLDLCPLCHKKGYKRKIILYQINLKEALWLCEYSECPWPFGYQDFTYVSRRVGEAWSSEWETCKPLMLKSSELFPISLTELGLDTPPVTPRSGNEAVNKDLVFRAGTCSVISSNLSTNNDISTEANSGSSKINSDKSRHSFISEWGGLDTESTGTSTGTVHFSSGVRSNDQDSNSQELFNCVSHSPKDKNAPSESKVRFSLGDKANLESLGECLSSSLRYVNACDAAEALTKSVFNVAKPLEDNLLIHESTAKCKKWLSDNTKSTINGDHCYSLSKPNKISVEGSNVFSEVVARRERRGSLENLNDTKPLPKIKCIEKTSVKLDGFITALNQKSTSAFANTEQTNSIVVVDSNKTVKTESKLKESSTSSDHCILFNNESIPESFSMCQNSVGSCEVGYTTVAIDALPPINISYEIPSLVEESVTVAQSMNSGQEVKQENVTFNLGQEPVVNNTVVNEIDHGVVDCSDIKRSEFLVNSGKTETHRQSMKKPLKRTIPKLAKYRGFNFGSLKKKSKSKISCSEENIKCSLQNVPSPDTASSCSDLTWTSETSYATMTTFDSKLESVCSSMDSNSKSTLSMESCTAEISGSDLKSNNTFSPENNETLQPNFNLDQVLDDLMLNENEDLTQNLGDDWLISLFN